MPDAGRFVPQRIESKVQHRLDKIRLAIQEQRHARRITRVQGEVPCPLGFQPDNARRPDTAVGALSRSDHEISVPHHTYAVGHGRIEK